eukprot:GFUD01036591.1.p1 GENE.GFUD01036591.1~~GFUD01036591.1.p1  ORF type:complete len:712 (-),score=115.95 GFUD01036591.1:595-2730(-)
MGMLGDGVICLIQAVVFVYDIVTYPLYTAVRRPWVVRDSYNKQRAEVVSQDKESIVIQAPHKMTKPLQELIDAGVDTMAKCFKFGLDKHTHAQCLGTRQLLDEEDETQPNGKVFKKWKLGEYTWQSYVDVDVSSTNFGKGLRELGQLYKQNICIFADTKTDWMVAAQACFKQTFPVVTLYTNLGDEAIVHAINQTEVEIVITTHDLLPKFKSILHKTQKVACLVYMEDQIHKTETSEYKSGVQIIGFKEVIENGKSSSAMPTLPEPSDPAIIMYTSGSTGVPKGVVLPHSALVATVRAFHFVAYPVRPGDIYLGYLPLAHILELLAENTMMVMGVPIGYSSPHTLTDKSTKILKGGTGDCTVLKPTLMCAVPLVLDRIFKGIQENVNKKGDFFKALFAYCHKYKMEWQRKGYTTPIMDRLVFKSVRALVGGRIRLMLSGGAPLSPETHEYIRITFGLPLVQGYGLTESCACACIMDNDDNSTGGSGTPLQGVQIKLINWQEGGYHVTDKPCPRGEVIIGGENVATGYFKMAQKTEQDFYTDDKGVRWFKTGDIGQIEPSGQLKIIDRKKDLVKLQLGEYISLGKVESELKTCPIVENVCIYGDPMQNYVVALIVPDMAKLEAIAEKLGLTDLSHEQLCQDKDVTGAVLRELQHHGKRLGLEKFELPGAVTLCTDMWTPESGLVTAAFKLKRKPIQDFYQKDLKRMYGARCA